VAPTTKHRFAVNMASLIVSAGHIVSRHQAFIDGVWLILKDRPMEPGLPAMAHGPKTWDESIFPWSRNGGSSSMFAVNIATHIFGYDRIILAGVPLDRSGRFYGDPQHDGQAGYEGFRPAWEAAAARGDLSHVRSLSGWTRELLGAPA
jgi:hypothetical protein